MLNWVCKWWRIWRRNRRHAVVGLEPQRHTLEGLGDFDVHPVTTAMYLWFSQAKMHGQDELLAATAYVVVENVEQYFGYTAQQLMMVMPPNRVNELCSLVLKVSGLTKEAQQDAEKKSPATQ